MASKGKRKAHLARKAEYQKRWREAERRAVQLRRRLLREGRAS